MVVECVHMYAYAYPHAYECLMAKGVPLSLA